MVTRADAASAVSRIALWFGFFGGAVAWLLHLIAVWLIAEFGCVLAGGQPAEGPVSTTAVLLIVASVICVGAAVAATVVSRRSERRLRDGAGTSDEGNARFMARAGWIMSGLFVFVIAVETIPIFYFLDHC